MSARPNRLTWSWQLRVGQARIAALERDLRAAAFAHVTIDEERRGVERRGDAEIGGGYNSHAQYCRSSIAGN